MQVGFRLGKSLTNKLSRAQGARRCQLTGFKDFCWLEKRRFSLTCFYLKMELIDISNYLHH